MVLMRVGQHQAGEVLDPLGDEARVRHDDFDRGRLVAAESDVDSILSNLISNVPAVLLLKPVVAHMPNARLGWLTAAAASTLAGNLTLLGSVANLIVAETAARWRIDAGRLELLDPQGRAIARFDAVYLR